MSGVGPAAAGALLVVAVLLASPRRAIRLPSPSAPTARLVDPGHVGPRGPSWGPIVVGLGSGALALLVVGGPLGAVLAVIVGVVVGGRRARRPTAAQRRVLAVEAAEVPQVVALVGTAVDAGLAPPAAVEVAVRALPGPAAARLESALARAALGADPALVWGPLESDPVWSPLARALSRAAESGASVQLVLARLADDLDRDARASAEQHARTVGVRAAVPLGVCLLPAFLLLGIVPLVAGLLGTVTR